MKEKNYTVHNCITAIKNLRSYGFPCGTEIRIPHSSSFADDEFRMDFKLGLKCSCAVSEIEGDEYETIITL